MCFKGRTPSGTVYSWENRFLQTHVGPNLVSIHYGNRDAIINPEIAMPPLTAQYNGNIPNTSLYFLTGNEGSLSGTVTDVSGVLAGVKITINDSFLSATTDETGQFIIQHINPATIGITAKKHRYTDYTYNNISIASTENTVYDFNMTERPKATITGKVIGSDTQEGLVFADITLTGYENYYAMTNYLGVFSIPDVYTDLTYEILIACEGYEIYSDNSLEILSENTNLGDFTLYERIKIPRNVQAVKSASQVALTWESPIYGFEMNFGHSLDEEAEWFYVGEDIEMIYASRFSPTQLANFGVAGATLKSVSFHAGWSIWAYNAVQTIRIYTGGSGSPLTPGNLIHEQNINFTDILPNYSGQPPTWSEISLTSPVTIPSDKELWIAIHLNTTNYFMISCDFGPAVQNYGNVLWFNGEWTNSSETSMSISNINFNFNWMLRAIAENATGLVRFGETRVLEGYSIYRSNINTIDDEATWDSIVSDVTDLFYNDSTWGQVTTGKYRYIVKSVFSNDVCSRPAFSNIVDKGFSSTVNVNLITSSGESVSGAVVRFVNNNGDDAQVYQQVATDNIVTFPAVFFGNYTLSVICKPQGFYNYTKENVVIQANQDDIEVVLTARKTFFDEDFESPMFPPYGWGGGQHGDEGGVGDLLSRYTTTGYDQAYEGNGFVVSISNTIFDTVFDIDNWLITPQIQLPASGNLAFIWYVGSYNRDAPYVQVTEPYKLLISTTGFELSNFQEIFSEVLPDNTAWQKRSVSLTDYAGQAVYIAFRHTTYHTGGSSHLKIDNVSIEEISHLPEKDIVETPYMSSLLNNYPNPFNPTTTIVFTVGNAFMHSEKNVGGTDKSVPYNVRIDIFNIKGQKVRQLTNGHYEVGTHKVLWNGLDDNEATVSSGIYFYRMRAGDFTETKKMMLMK
jgi:hypothetical protein